MTPTDLITIREMNTLEARRAKAREYLGTKWVLHPMHAPSKKVASTHEMRRELWERQRGVGPKYSDLRAEARMLDWKERVK